MKGWPNCPKKKGGDGCLNDDPKDDLPRGWFTDYGDEDIYFIDGSKLKAKKKVKERGYYSEIPRKKKKGKGKR